ncbi:Uncharacterised protein [Enterobacter cloacae]|uniref:Uncharacterized protein n=1 Tax=Enterobacter cloacae TaxID=550 RepID=A0A377LQ49_ENTCL|nr:Uncharacterised protein [Enterobacter cloacae]
MMKDSFNHMRKQGSKTEMVTQSPDNLRCFPPPDEQQRIERAIELASRFGGSDEVHHLRWVIDQMVRSWLASVMIRLSPVLAPVKMARIPGAGIRA